MVFTRVGLAGLVAGLVVSVVGCGRSAPRLDGSSPEAFAESLAALRSGPDGEAAGQAVQRLVAAEVARSPGDAAGAADRLRKRLDGMTAAEVVEAGAAVKLSAAEAAALDVAAEAVERGAAEK
jgi:hypothetical protein